MKNLRAFNAEPFKNGNGNIYGFNSLDGNGKIKSLKFCYPYELVIY